MADQAYWLGLMTAGGAEPVASEGYARVRLVLPEGATYTNTAPIMFCRARRAWPILTQAGLFQTADPGSPRAWVATLRTLPGWTTPQPLAVDEGEEATIPPYGLELLWAFSGTPRPYGLGPYGTAAYSRGAPPALRKFGKYQFGTKAFGMWNTTGFAGMRCGARLLADRVPVVCAPWARVEPWQGRVCA